MAFTAPLPRYNHIWQPRFSYLWVLFVPLKLVVEVSNMIPVVETVGERNSAIELLFSTYLRPMGHYSWRPESVSVSAPNPSAR